MVIEMSVALIAVAFAALAIYLIITLKFVRVSLDQANDLLKEIRRDSKDVIRESTSLMLNTNQVVTDIHGKIKSTDAIFKSIHDVGDAVQEVTSSVKEASSAVSRTLTKSVNHTIHQNESKIIETVEMASYIFNRYRQWKNNKKL